MPQLEGWMICVRTTTREARFAHTLRFQAGSGTAVENVKPKRSNTLYNEHRPRTRNERHAKDSKVHQCGRCTRPIVIDQDQGLVGLRLWVTTIMK